ncbi:MAG: hypothetical protein DI539_10180 [Flavobacterium psychrophilum]|nr:MAG: hypothetical protein DI539_10180 [Flavobacterium psychrophilum]
MKFLYTILILFLCIGCRPQPKEIIIYEKEKTVPMIVMADESLKASADYFAGIFETSFGDKIEVGEKPTNDKYIELDIIKKDKNKDYFTITSDYRSVKIVGTSVEEVKKGICYFFRQYAGVHYISGRGIIPSANKIITVPTDLDFVQTYAFEYREPYFPDNYDVEFRNWYDTHAMEDAWGIWGHNLFKVVGTSPEMMAKVDGTINEEQFCFSGTAFEEALTSYIRKMTIDESLRSKFMIQPNDNGIVCQCDRCKALGNTPNNASPAVFSLLNKLAKKFPEQQFFSTAYMTTLTPPKFRLADNAGVMISTMSFPKGIVMEQSGKKPVTDKIFADWRKVTNTIYMWDYAINFDNYFKAYPTMLIAQANLKYYKKQGVTGVFMQGSEDQYSAYADLKNYLYALLLQNPDIDIKKETTWFFKTKYPDVADLLIDNYLSIEQRSFDKKILLDIYGGMLQSKKKYLNEDDFNSFYSRLYEKAKALDKNRLKDLEPLLLSLTFIKLELLRTNGYQNSPGEAVHEEAKVLLDRVSELYARTGIKTYNETGALISDYSDQWRSEVLDKPYHNLLFGKKVKLDFTQDEEYTNAAVLTDGAVGFDDYYNNWMICSLEPLAVKVNANDVIGTTKIEMDFLLDSRHNIYPPERVEVTVGKKKYETKIMLNADKKVSKQHVVIPVTILPQDEEVHIKTIKFSEYKTKSMACDEIFFKK